MTEAPNTYQAKADFGLFDGGTASQQAEKEHHHGNADDDHGGDHDILVRQKVMEVAVAADDVGPHVGQGGSCCLQRDKSQ